MAKPARRSECATTRPLDGSTSHKVTAEIGADTAAASGAMKAVNGRRYSGLCRLGWWWLQWSMGQSEGVIGLSHIARHGWHSRAGTAARVCEAEPDRLRTVQQALRPGWSLMRHFFSAPLPIARLPRSVFAPTAMRVLVALSSLGTGQATRQVLAGNAILIAAVTGSAQQDLRTAASAPKAPGRGWRDRAIHHGKTGPRGWTSRAKCAICYRKPHRGGYGQARHRSPKTCGRACPGLGSRDRRSGRQEHKHFRRIRAGWAARAVPASLRAGSLARLPFAAPALLGATLSSNGGQCGIHRNAAGFGGWVQHPSLTNDLGGQIAHRGCRTAVTTAVCPSRRTAAPTAAGPWTSGN